MKIFAYLGFFASIVALGYTYFGYPVLVYVIAAIYPKKVIRSDVERSVTVLITAYNEESSIAEKIQNTLALDYPAEKLEILVASDGSSDQTDRIVESFADRGVKLFHQAGRKGKTHTQNMAVTKATGEIIVFSDATTHYSGDVIRKLIPSFADESVGCVAGRLIYESQTENAVGQGATAYWGYETTIKKSESKACSLIGVSGCMYAVRKSSYRPMYDEACSDFLICAVLYREGYRSVYEPDAVCFEETNVRSEKELKMRERVIAQTFNDLWRNRDMLNPFKVGFYAIELMSHKVLRYSVPLWMILLFVSNLLLAKVNVGFAGVLALQIGFYSCAILGWVLERKGIHISILSLPFYFVLGMVSTVKGFYSFLTGERYANWEPIRENNSKRESRI